jgi:hypothetical protein
MLQDLTNEQLVLADFMSDISERCYYAGWEQNLEYVLWNSILNGPRSWGHGEISKTDIDFLENKSSEINSWIIFDNENEETGISLSEWKEKFKKMLNKTLA